jgi:aromatic ring-cleaving dioxygenase
MPGNNACNPNHHEHHYFDSKEINQEEEVERQLTEKITEIVKKEY